MTVFTEHLVEPNRDLWMAMAGHPLVQQDRIFVVEERLDDLLADLDDNLELEAEAFTQPAIGHGVAPEVGPWTGEPFQAVVSALGCGLDELTGTPSPILTRRLGTIFTGAARFELAFWEMCWSGQAWPG